jgi:uncharacterized protein (TIGR00251 family)
MEASRTRLRVRVAPGARTAAVVGRHGSGWKLRVAAPPVDGKANEAVLRLLAETLAVPRARVALVSGHGGRDKVVELTGISSDETERRLAARAHA